MSLDAPEENAILSDSHAHLDRVASGAGEEVLSACLGAYGRAWAEGKGLFIVDIGVDPGDLAGRIERFGSCPFVKFAAGIWPGGEALAGQTEALSLLEKDLASGRCRALGECGLDYHHMNASRESQMRLFEAQAEMAAGFGLPLVVHSRDAFDDTYAVVKKHSGRMPVIIHCFSYGRAEAALFLDAGCFVSFAGNISFRKSESLLEALASVPEDRLLLETDAPYMNPVPRRGKPSSSLDIARTLKRAAASRNCAEESLAARVNANAFSVFAGKSA